MRSFTVDNLKVSIDGKEVCEHLTLIMKPGQVWALLGQNGVGKTTLLHTLAGLRSADSGVIRINDSEIDSLHPRTRAQKIGLLFQHHDDVFPASVLETVLSGRHPHLSAWEWESSEDRRIAMHSLAQVKMLEMAERQVDQLSGGERQRVAIAALLAQDPGVFLLDEPTSHLDLRHQMRLLKMLAEFAGQKERLLIMSLHDVNLAMRFATHALLLMGDGQYQAGPVEAILQATLLEQLYACPLQQVEVNGRRYFFPTDETAPDNLYQEF